MPANGAMVVMSYGRATTADAPRGEDFAHDALVARLGCTDQDRNIGPASNRGHHSGGVDVVGVSSQDQDGRHLCTHRQ